MNSARPSGFRRLPDHPGALRPLFFTELWERFSYYGMRALLVLFMVDSIQNGGLGLTDKTATAIYGLYTAAVYLTTLPGGWIADKLLGYHRAVLYGAITIMLGHFTLAIPSPLTFYPGLLLVALGTGLLKPNISAMVGKLYPPEAHAARDGGFVLFYMGINLGAILGPLICSWLGENPALGWHFGFAAAGIGMALGLWHYHFSSSLLLAYSGIAQKPEASPLAQRKLLIGSTLVAAAILLIALSGLSVLTVARAAVITISIIFLVIFIRLALFTGFTTRERKQIIVLGILCAAAAVFWSGFEQAGSSLNLFAQRFTIREFDAFNIPAGWFQSLNPVFVVVLAPLFSALWLLLARRGISPSEPLKFSLALILMGVGFVVMMLAANKVVTSGPVLPVWLISTFLIHTIAELCLSPIGLSAVSRLAPQGYTGIMMGMWFLTASLGNLLAGLFAGRFDPEQLEQMPVIFSEIALYGIVAGLVMLLMVIPIRRLLATN